MSINTKSIDVGPHYYRMPHWDEWLLVNVIRDDHGELAVRFKDGYYPTLVSDLPADGQLVHYDDFDEPKLSVGYIFYITFVGVIFALFGLVQYVLTSKVSVLSLIIGYVVSLLVPILRLEYLTRKSKSKKVA